VASPRSARARSSDIKLIVAATVGVLLAGFLIAGAALVATRGSGSVVCDKVNEGSAADIRQNLQDEGPSFHSSGANCGFWLALQDGNIVAYKVKQPSGCTLNLRDRATRWICGGVEVEPTTLAQYPVSIEKFGQIDALFVDLVPPQYSSTTASTTSTTVG
jgi:hypothetical protein